MLPAPILLHRIFVPVRWGDMDSVGHVNNANYFRYMEQCRVEWFEKVGIGAFPPSNDIYAVMLTGHCTFEKPIHYPSTVEVTISASEIGRTSLTTTHELLVEGLRYAHGGAKLVFVSVKTERPVPIPEVVLALLNRPDSA